MSIIKLLSTFLSVAFTFCSGQEAQRTLPKKRLVEKRLKALLTVEMPSLSKEQEEGLPARCLSTPLVQEGLSDKKSPSMPLAPTGIERFSWTPDTPQTTLFKKTFTWTKELMNKIFGSP